MGCSLWVVLGTAVLLATLGAREARPSVSHYFPAFFGPRSASRLGTAAQSRRQYSGQRTSNHSQMTVYMHDQTVAITELLNNEVVDCELIEIAEPHQVRNVVGNLGPNIDKIPITFEQMLALMAQCQEVEDERSAQIEDMQSDQPSNRGFLSTFSLLSGIIPGTKWCGPGDIASTYHDLGADSMTDKCCRAHDLCPVKVRSRSHNYNLTNNALYTKSHCKCDDNLYRCLKRAESYRAQVVGNIYFNIVQPNCVHEAPHGREFRSANEDYWFEVYEQYNTNNS